MCHDAGRGRDDNLRAGDVDDGANGEATVLDVRGDPLGKRATASGAIAKESGRHEAADAAVAQEIALLVGVNSAVAAEQFDFAPSFSFALTLSFALCFSFALALTLFLALSLVNVVHARAEEVHAEGRGGRAGRVGLAGQLAADEGPDGAPFEREQQQEQRPRAHG